MNQTVKDAIWGAIGGLAGTFVIGKVMGAMSSLQSEEDKKREHELMPEPPTEKLVGRVAGEAFGTPIEKETKAELGKGVQWSYGIFWGAVYGVLRRELPAISKAAGLPFGMGLTVLGSAVLLPAAKLAPTPEKLPLSSHVRGIVSHAAYAATVEGVCELLDSIDRASEQIPQRTNAELRRVS